MLEIQTNDLVRDRMVAQIRQKIVNSGQYFGGLETAQAWANLSKLHPQRQIECLPIIKSDTRPFFAIDLGPGSGAPAVRILKNVSELLGVVGVDTSADMLSIAEKTVGRALHCSFHSIVADFIRDKAALKQALDTFVGRKIVMCLGGTVGNYPASVVFPVLTSLLNKDDWLLLGMGTYEDVDQNESLQRLADFFLSEENCRFGLRWLIACGVQPDRKFTRAQIEPDGRHEGVYMIRGYYTFPTNTTLDVLGQKIAIPAGYEIQWVESRRYNPMSINALVSTYSLQLLAAQQFVGHGLYLCQRAN